MGSSLFSALFSESRAPEEESEDEDDDDNQ
jgi:hypothetical protein